MQPSAQEKGRKNSAVLHTMWRQKAMVPREVRAHCSIVRLAKRREGLGVQSLADLANLPLTGYRAFVLYRTKLLSRQISSSDLAEGRKKGRSSRAASEQRKM